jgi:UDP-N-acetylglucosamine 2-epimerase
VRLLEPVGYLEMLALEQHAARIATDSGGVQKEAYLLGVPCVTLRNDTEWVETLQDRWNVLVGSDSEAISAALAQPAPTAERRNPFGAGDAAERIARSLCDWP